MDCHNLGHPSRDVLGQRSLSRDIFSCPCPETKGHQTRFFFVPRQRDNGTSRPVNYLIWNVQYSKASLSSCLYKCLRLYGKCFTPSLTKMTGGPRWAYNIMDLVNISFIFLIIVLPRIFGWKWQSVKCKLGIFRRWYNKEICTKMAQEKGGISLPWWCHALVFQAPGSGGLFLNLIVFS